MPATTSLLVTSHEKWKSFFQSLRASAWVVLSDTNTSRHCLPYFRDTYLGDIPFLHLEVPAGEAFKSIGTAQHLWKKLLENTIDRDAVLLCLGGGMLTDLGGFVGSTYKRGIRTVYVPTTNLAMTDAALGGKTGVNFDTLKNQVGTFHQPEAVVIDTHFLHTLPGRELKSGFAETVKHALIASPGLWERISTGTWQDTVMDEEIILESIRIKEGIVAHDPGDRGIRQALNFGHTAGHAAEAVSHTSDAPLLHGEAIIFGMLAESYIAFRQCALPLPVFTQIRDWLTGHFSLAGIKNIDVQTCIEQMLHDKKNSHGHITCSLISNIGMPEIGVQVAKPLLAESIEFAKAQWINEIHS